MRVKDFEGAIEALKVDGLGIDEFKMVANGCGQVCLVNGHTKDLTLIWDESGRAFSTSIYQESESFIEYDSGKAMTGRRLKRDTRFDLKFE
jgi:hypothetical protein